MNRHVVVIGGAGFIGANLCRALVAQGSNVICVDNFSTGCRWNINTIKTNFEFVAADASDDKTWRYLHGTGRPLHGVDECVDEVYYLASLASPKHYLDQPLATIRANVHGLEKALHFAQLAGARLLYTSTSEVYGDPEQIPQTEDYPGRVWPTADRSVYDESKRLGETLCSIYQRRGYDVKIVRIFNTYGPFMAANDGRVIPNFIMNCMYDNPLELYGGGRQTRSFCYVDDMVHGLIKMMDSDELGPINLGNPNEWYSIEELAEEVSMMMRGEIARKKRVEFPSQHDPKHRRPDIELAYDKLGWVPKWGLEQGLRETIKFFRGRYGIKNG